MMMVKEEGRCKAESGQEQDLVKKQEAVPKQELPKQELEAVPQESEAVPTQGGNDPKNEI